MHLDAGLAVGKHDYAIEELRKATQLSGDAPYYVAELGVAYARAGLRTEAREKLRALDQLSRITKMSQRAVLLAALGESSDAIRALDQALADHDDRLVWLQVDPQFDVLRDDPQFSELRKRLNFPH